jgi:hypothetical protein
LERAKLQDFVAGAGLRSAARALHPLAHETLELSFDATAPNRKSMAARVGVPHQALARAQVANGVADGTTAGLVWNVLEAATSECAEDSVNAIVTFEKPALRATKAAWFCPLVLFEQAARGSETLERVPVPPAAGEGRQAKVRNKAGQAAGIAAHSKAAGGTGTRTRVGN